MKRLVLLADGTWMTVRNRTNVARLSDAVLPVAADGVRQVVLYNEGVGTRPGLDRLLGGAFGTGLGREVRTCYRRLVESYEEGDQVLMFGYSRGAFTVRSVGGLINNLGLLRPEHADRVDEAYDHYRDRSTDWLPHGRLADDFRTRYGSPGARINCLGVWDTVGSLGVPTSGPIGWMTRRLHAFHDVRLGGVVDHAFQALAVDEHRRPFAPAVWMRADAHLKTGQQLEQRWFAGSHGDVGGGHADTGLADLALDWMAERAGSCGLDVDRARLGTRPRYDARLHDSYTTFFGATDLVQGRDQLLRPIGRPDEVGEDGDTYRSNEDVSDPARRRYDERVGTPPYHPANLAVFLTRRGIPQH
jgi:uncharacterized protein (DUF2235 family)